MPRRRRSWSCARSTRSSRRRRTCASSGPDHRARPPMRRSPRTVPRSTPMRPAPCPGPPRCRSPWSSTPPTRWTPPGRSSRPRRPPRTGSAGATERSRARRPSPSTPRPTPACRSRATRPTPSASSTPSTASLRPPPKRPAARRPSGPPLAQAAQSFDDRPGSQPNIVVMTATNDTVTGATTRAVARGSVRSSGAAVFAAELTGSGLDAGSLDALVASSGGLVFSTDQGGDFATAVVRRRRRHQHPAVRDGLRLDVGARHRGRHDAAGR